MKKLLIPGIAAGAVLIALAFVVAPAQEATAVHTTAQTNAMRQFMLVAEISPDTGTNDAIDEEAWFALSQSFELIGASVTFTADTGADCDLGASNIRTDYVAEAGLVEANPSAIDSVTDTRALFLNADTQTSVFGDTVLAIALSEGANCDADSRVLLAALVNTTGGLTGQAPVTRQLTTAPKAGGLAGD